MAGGILLPRWVEVKIRDGVASLAACALQCARGRRFTRRDEAGERWIGKN